MAIVNLDKGQDDTNQGNELVKELKDKDVLDLCVVDENQAKQGLQDGEYYATFCYYPTNDNPVFDLIQNTNNCTTLTDLNSISYL